MNWERNGLPPIAKHNLSTTYRASLIKVVGHKVLTLRCAALCLGIAALEARKKRLSRRRAQTAQDDSAALVLQSPV